MCLLYPQKKKHQPKMFIETVRYRLLYHIPVPPPNKRCLCYIFGTSLNRRVQRTFNVHQQTSFQVVSLLPCGMKQLTGLKKSKVFWFETSRNRTNATNAWYNTHRYTTCKWLVRRFFFDEGTLYRLCVLRIVCTDAQQKKIYEQWKKGPWLFRVYRG